MTCIGKYPKCQIRTVNLFGLYRQEDIENVVLASSKSHENLVPWIELDTVVTEEIDFTSGRGTRTLSIKTPQPPPQVNEEIDELF